MDKPTVRLVLKLKIEAGRATISEEKKNGWQEILWVFCYLDPANLTTMKEVEGYFSAEDARQLETYLQTGHRVWAVGRVEEDQAHNSFIVLH